MIQTLCIGKKIKIIRNNWRRRFPLGVGGTGVPSSRRDCLSVFGVDYLLLLPGLGRGGGVGGHLGGGLPQGHRDAGYTHDLSVGIHVGFRRFICLTNQTLQHVHNLWVVEEGVLPGLGLALGGQEDHEGGLRVAVDLLLLGAQAWGEDIRCRSRGGTALSFLWRNPCLYCLDLCLDDIL